MTLFELKNAPRIKVKAKQQNKIKSSDWRKSWYQSHFSRCDCSCQYSKLNVGWKYCIFWAELPVSRAKKQYYFEKKFCCRKQTKKYSFIICFNKLHSDEIPFMFGKYRQSVLLCVRYLLLAISIILFSPHCCCWHFFIKRNVWMLLGTFRECKVRSLFNTDDLAMNISASPQPY